MPAQKEIGSSSLSLTGRLGIIAGGGDLPIEVARACAERKVSLLIIALAGSGVCETDFQGHDIVHYRLGALGGMMKALRSHDISDIILAGRVKRPSLAQLWPDLKGLQFMLFQGLRAFSLGDDGLLRALRRFLEGEGFSLQGAHHWTPELLTPLGVLTQTKPDDGLLHDIEKGFIQAKLLGQQDIGQGLVVQKGKVIVAEDFNGTDAMIKRSASLLDDRDSAILVKVCKPQQDRDFDLPTIGLQTVKLAVESGLSGIVLEAGASFFLNKSAALDYADAHGLFIYGVEGHAYE